MAPLNPRSDLETHTVENQPEPRGDRDLWADDTILRGAVARAGGASHEKTLSAYGAQLGTDVARDRGRQANRFFPELQTFDRGGQRIDEVTFHPAYHDLMALGVGAGYPAIAWDGGPGGHTAHAAMVYMQSQVEPGVCCPMTMTYAAVPALAAAPALDAEWRPRLLSRQYDPASRPAVEKTGATIGMAMTEKQGGSDLRTNTTRAEPDDGDFRLTGHKWFCSAPMSDAFLTLARTANGLTCFLVPRWTPDGERNAIQIMRLKDKLGNRANASSEIEYHGAWAKRVGEEGQGIKVILEMVHHTRLDTATAPAGLMRAAISEALWWCRERTAFQKKLIDQPLMAAVLADLGLELEGAVALCFRVARAFDESAGDESARRFARLAVALAKYAANKACPGVVVEAMECLGGGGYVEESPMPLLFRESPLNSIWEGSGNVICLDILRTIARDPDTLEMARAELAAARGLQADFDGALDVFNERWLSLPPESEMRWFSESLATLLSAALLLQGAASDTVAAAYCSTRLGASRGKRFGALPAGFDPPPILARLS
ncbi:MAG: acyl-CoA dehydrogenase family protein [Paracoccaceae bacterium]